jgi:hypothetical protein
MAPAVLTDGRAFFAVGILNLQIHNSNGLPFRPFHAAGARVDIWRQLKRVWLWELSG